jgi:hypothetical protein
LSVRRQFGERPEEWAVFVMVLSGMTCLPADPAGLKYDNGFCCLP